MSEANNIALTQELTHSFQSSDWIALSSVVIALCVFCITIWQAWFTRRHSIMSVRPIIDLQPLNDTASQEDTYIFEIKITNMGLGPAIINNICYLLDKEPQGGSLYKQIYEIGLNESASISHHYAFVDTVVLSTNNSIQLLYLEAESKNYHILQHHLKKIDVLIEYQDMYGNIQPSINSVKLKNLATQAL